MKKLPFKYIFLNSQQDAKNRLTEIFEYLKNQFNVDHVFNFDIRALSSWFDNEGLEFYQFNRIKTDEINGFIPDIRTDGKIKVLCISFAEITKHFDVSFMYVTGDNKSEATYSDDNETFWDKDLNLCMYWFDYSKESMIYRVERIDAENKAWKHFNTEVRPRMDCKRLGEKFEVFEPISDHFLNCLPPIYGKGCFYCSEPYSSTSEGKNIYYKLTKSGDKHFIEFNIVER